MTEPLLSVTKKLLAVIGFACAANVNTRASMNIAYLIIYYNIFFGKMLDVWFNFDGWCDVPTFLFRSE